MPNGLQFERYQFEMQFSLPNLSNNDLKLPRAKNYSWDRRQTERIFDVGEHNKSLSFCCKSECAPGDCESFSQGYSVVGATNKKSIFCLSYQFYSDDLFNLVDKIKINDLFLSFTNEFNKFIITKVEWIYLYLSLNYIFSYKITIYLHTRKKRNK